MVRQRSSLRGTAAAAVAAAALALLVFGLEPAYTDDIDLLRFTTAKPYVYFIIDNSASMNLALDGSWVHANGDDPRSKLYQVKSAVYEVFKDVNDIQFGFASFNQDYARVTAKHWVYYYMTDASNKLPNDWPIDYPAADANGPITFNTTTETFESDIQGDFMTFGAHLDATGILGTCAAPLSFGSVGADDREKINRYSKLGETGTSATKLWIQGGAGNKTYLLTVDRPTKKPDTIADNPQLGQNDMDVVLTLQEVKSGSSGCTDALAGTFQSTKTARITLTLWTGFLMNDEANGRTVKDDTHNAGGDFLAGFWNNKDIQDVASCGSGHPFSGTGWEGNYDTTPPAVGANIDPFCSNAANPATCYNLKRTTVPDPDYGAQKVLDKGDMLPFDWRSEQKTEFLQRFAPNYGAGSPDFGIASYFKDQKDAVTSLLKLESSNQIPLFASGPSPLSKAVVDFRCWYLGDSNKCNSDAYPTGWETLAGQNDSEWGCRKPYLIVISDGGDSCAGENPCADTADLNSKAGIQTWVIAFGADKGTGNPLKCMAQNGKGELLFPASKRELREELQKILGLIRQEARSFASAAVPSVQAVVDDKIFLTNFTPLNAKPVWDGHVHAFFKPIPPTQDGKPNTSLKCPVLNPLTNKKDLWVGCHAWDAGKVMLDTQVNATDPTGKAASQRRVYYTRENTTGEVPLGKGLFKDPGDDDTVAAGDVQDFRFDLWKGLGLGTTFDPTDTTLIATTKAQADAVIAKTFAVKTAIVDVRNADGTTTPTTIRYILGDVFHSNPLVVGNPPNVQYFALDVDGYQDFAEEHRLRRKMLLVGANDGMLHAFDAGMFNRTNTAAPPFYGKFEGKFDMGTGNEIFAYIPRGVLPTVKLLAEAGTTNHQWSMDGTVTVADAFIDPKSGDGSDKKEWRTLAISGLREGGALVYALDITQPDGMGSETFKDPLLPGKMKTELNVPNPGRPQDDYIPTCLEESGACGTLPFPSVLWEFDDTVLSGSTRVQLDEEPPSVAFPLGGNKKPDLGESWSVPNVGRIKIAVSTGSTTTRDVYVAIFGGGLDPANKTSPQRGTWLYMVDVETGKAIYKRRLTGAMPSEPSAVDTNGDGYLDRIYAATTAGLLYRIDLAALDLQDPADPTDDIYPALATLNVWGADDAAHPVQRIPTTAWVPLAIFNASTELGVPTVTDRPIYFRPSVIFDAKLGTYLVAFGTGDRQDLWLSDAQTGRFFVFMDDSDKLPAASLPMTELNFKRILVADAAAGTNIETLPPGQRGWYLVLDTNERVINDPFGLSGVTFFSTYKPRVDITTTKEGPQCSKSGISRIFIVATLTANPFVQPPTGVTSPPIRAFEVSNFVTNPFTEQRQTKNQTDGTTVKEICDDPTKIAIMESLKTLFPPTCKFGNYMVDIKTIAADTRLVCIAPVPVCLITKNWKEY